MLDNRAGQAGCPISRPGRPQRLHVCAAIKKDTDKHVVCSKTLVGKPTQVKRLQRKCQDILDFSLGKAANKENGILEFTCSQDSYALNVFHFWERYDGNTSMGKHNTSPEFMKFMEGVSSLHP
jgi:quinol monooxygenase YgiN